ncbi:MAG: VanZ family protein [Candidatus Promineifilaceae bacterium]
MRNKLQLGFIVYVLAVVVVSLVPARSIQTPGPLDKVGHFMAYAIMAYLGLVTFKSRRASILVILFSLTLGMVLEFLQSFISGRDPSIADGMANFIGVLIGAGVFLLIRDSDDR